MHSRLIGACSIFAILSACAEKGPGPVISAGDRYSAAEASAPSDYRLGVGDRIKLSVFNESSLSGQYSVNANGAITLPLIGDVPAQGRTIGEVLDATQARYADGYLRDPKVSGEVATFRPFYILGEVDKPGQYPYVVGLTAMNAIATAQGFTARANRDVVRIRRNGETEEKNYKLTPELIVHPGDTLRVGERYF